jgi:hypothetical protein
MKRGEKEFGTSNKTGGMWANFNHQKAAAAEGNWASLTNAGEEE